MPYGLVASLLGRWVVRVVVRTPLGRRWFPLQDEVPQTGRRTCPRCLFSMKATERSCPGCLTPMPPVDARPAETA